MCRKFHNMSETSIAIGGATGRSGNLSTSLSNIARLAADPKFVWVFNANYDGTIIYNVMTLYLYCFILFQYTQKIVSIEIKKSRPATTKL
jgi:hypothetical protein